MELGALVCVSGTPRCSVCPVRNRCAWRLAGYPPDDGPPKRVQKFAGTDRQVRGRLLDVLRAAHHPVTPVELHAAWDDAVQRSRCLDSLLAAGRVEQPPGGLFRLPSGGAIRWCHAAAAGSLHAVLLPEDLTARPLTPA